MVTLQRATPVCGRNTMITVHVVQRKHIFKISLSNSEAEASELLREILKKYILTTNSNKKMTERFHTCLQWVNIKCFVVNTNSLETGD